MYLLQIILYFLHVTELTEDHTCDNEREEVRLIDENIPISDDRIHGMVEPTRSFGNYLEVYLKNRVSQSLKYKKKILSFK